MLISYFLEEEILNISPVINWYNLLLVTADFFTFSLFKAGSLVGSDKYLISQE